MGTFCVVVSLFLLIKSIHQLTGLFQFYLLLNMNFAEVILVHNLIMRAPFILI